MLMSCKKYKMLLEEAQIRELSVTEQAELDSHLTECSDCLEEVKQHKIISKLFQESSELENDYIIPQELMRSRVEQQLYESSEKKPVWQFIRNPILISAFSLILVLIGFQYMTKPKPTNNAFQYSVSLDGVNVAMVEDNEIICEMLYTIGLPEASIDVLGCDTTCEVVIFDLKTRQEAEKVVRTLHTLDKDLKNTDIKAIEQYNI